eukprot:169649-Amphidinium_carterae.3
MAKRYGPETSEEEQMEGLAWSRTDRGVKTFVGSGVGGPVWDTVWKGSTYNEDDGKLISEELTKSITKKDLYRPLPEGVKNIKTVLHYRIDDGEKEQKVAESREENVTFKKPAGDPTHRDIKMKAKSTPVSTHHVTSSTGEERNKWVKSINKELESFYNNHAVEDATAELVARCREVGSYHAKRMVICGNCQPWEQDESNSTNNLDAPLLRWMLSAFCDIPPEHLVLLKPPKSLIDLKLIKESKIWLAVRAVYGLRAAPRLWEQSRRERLQR